MEQIPTMFELALLELLRRNVDVDSVDPPLVRDLEKYIIAYQMCKTPETKYILAVENQHNHIAKFYSLVNVPYFETKELTYLLALSYQAKNKLPYDEDILEYLVDEEGTEINSSTVLVYLMDLAARYEDTALFRRVYSVYSLCERNVSANMFSIIRYASLTNNEDILRLVLPEAPSEDITAIVYLTNTDVIDSILEEGEYDIDMLVDIATRIGQKTAVFLEHVTKNYK